MTDHPITPPPELRCQWQSESPFRVISVEREDYMIDRAAQWGADMELEACCAFLMYEEDRQGLRAARRPKPLSLKEQALMALEDGDTGPGASLTSAEVCIIRRALEQLPND